MITTQWYNKEKTMILSTFEDNWSIVDFRNMRQSWHRMIRKFYKPVPIVIDLSGTINFPKNGLSEFLAIQRTPHINQGKIYIFGLNKTYETVLIHLFDTVINEYQQIIQVRNIEEAIDLINNN